MAGESDILSTASSASAHFSDSPWWNISREMNGPDLRDRFNREILPLLDGNKDGSLTEVEISQGQTLFADTRTADAVKLLHDYFSFFLDFRGGNTPGYAQILNGETMGRYAEFDKSMKRFNSQVHATVDYALRNFGALDTDGSKCLSSDELDAKATTGSAAQRDAAKLLSEHFWEVKSFAACEGPTSGIGPLALIELRQRRTDPGNAATAPGNAASARGDAATAPGTQATATADGMEMPVKVEKDDPAALAWRNLPVEREDPVEPTLRNTPVEREDPPVLRHKFQTNRGGPARVVPPRPAPPVR